jgi:hypothetical protein
LRFVDALADEQGCYQVRNVETRLGDEVAQGSRRAKSTGT